MKRLCIPLLAALALAARAETVVYEVTEESAIGFTGHKDLPLIGKGSKNGSFLTYEGTVELTNNDPATLVIKGKVDMASLETDSEKLTEALNSDSFFASNKQAESTFVSKSVKKTDKGVEVTGELTIKGKPATITFPATVTQAGDKVTVNAQFQVDRHLWDIKYTGPFVKDTYILSNADISWKIVAQKKK